jgi:diguanylate cyclase (GGDEF)-like protein
MPEGTKTHRTRYNYTARWRASVRLNKAMQQELTVRKRTSERQSLIYAVLQAVSGQLDLLAVVHTALEAVAKNTNWPHVCFAMRDEDGDHWVIRGAGGQLAAALGTTGLINQGVIGRVFRTNQYQLVPDTMADPDYISEIEEDSVPASDHMILRSELAVPLRRGEKLLGVLNLESTRLGEFDMEDVQLVESLADAIALALDNALLYEEAQREIIERKRAEEKLIYQSTHDYLTGLNNRTYFEEQLMSQRSSWQFPFSLIMIDLDNFKQINDTLGHSAGDECLKQAAAVLKSAFGNEAVIARIGGDEFSVLLPGADEQNVKDAVQRIRKHWDDYFPSSSFISTIVNLSIGHATTAPGEKLFNALKRADKLMYDEKNSKRH